MGFIDIKLNNTKEITGRYKTVGICFDIQYQISLIECNFVET